MALSKSTLEAAIKACLDDASEGKTTATAASQLATAIDTYVRSAVVSVTVTTTGTAAAQAGSGTGTLS